MKNIKALITTVPFGELSDIPLKLLKESGINYEINPLKRRLTELELIALIADFDILIAGTEPITKNVINAAPKLKLISRAGIGLDNVDLLAAEEAGILVSYTPDAPAPAVADLTIGLIYSLLRSIQIANLDLHSKLWLRRVGTRIQDATIGIIGMGRIGSKVVSHLENLGVKKILVNDLIFNKYELFKGSSQVIFADPEQIFLESNVISLHLPLTPLTVNYLNTDQFNLMKNCPLIINTSRGGVINESALIESFSLKKISGAAIDVYEDEPYDGRLTDIREFILTSHMGSMTNDCRVQMEIEATQEACRYVKDHALLSLVPVDEYNNKSEL